MSEHWVDRVEKRCEWCGFPAFGDNRCVCDSPLYVSMEQCEGCEQWFRVEDVVSEMIEGDEYSVCLGCHRGGGGTK